MTIMPFKIVRRSVKYMTGNMHGSSYAIHGGYRDNGRLCKWHTGSQAYALHTQHMHVMNNINIYGFMQQNEHINHYIHGYDTSL